MQLAALAVVVAILLLATAATRGQSSSIGTPPPEGVVELVGVGGISSSLVELKDGTLMIVNPWDGYRLSDDGGLTWTDGQEFEEEISVNSVIRLQSGALALSRGAHIWLSRDEGDSWQKVADPFPDIALTGPEFFYDEMIQLDSGRLIYPCSVSYSGEHPWVKYNESGAFGNWQGQRMGVEGHGHVPEIYITFLSYSDDEGQSWHYIPGKNPKRPNALMGWFDDQGRYTGYRGVQGCGEAAVAETEDGRVLLFARSTVNRVVHSYSEDGGENWSPVLPTALANSLSPARLRRIPQTGDLMCVWNQVSREEIRRGYRRGRLSVAISQDSGATWAHFKTIEVSAGLQEVGRIPPQYPIELPRAPGWEGVGKVPDNWAYFHYANIQFVGDKVFILYSRGSPLMGIAEQDFYQQEQVTRIYPLAWFYE